MIASVIEMGSLIACVSVLLAILAVSFWRALRAEGRAWRMLTSLLTEAELRQLASKGYLEIPSPSAPGRAYRIPRRAGRVRMYEDGRLVCELCLQPTIFLPPSDLVMLHKFLIEGDEATYLATANRFPSSLYLPYWAG